MLVSEQLLPSVIPVAQSRPWDASERDGFFQTQFAQQCIYEDFCLITTAQGTKKRPTVLIPPVQSDIFNTRSNCSISQMHPTPRGVHDDVVPLVPVLLGVCGPAAVFRRIVSIIVYAFKSQPRPPRRLHIGAEGSEAMPSLAYLNAAASIQPIIDCARIFAPRSHAIPPAMQRMLLDWVFKFSVHPIGLYRILVGGATGLEV